jgi:membrane-associated phospholipid phosphatase
MLSLREMVIYGLWIGGLCLTGLGVFYVWPTAVPPMAVAVDVAAHPGFAVLAGVDAGGNACPSLHVATAVFSALWLHRLLSATGAPWPSRWLNALWALAIVYSTLAIRQHVVWDMVAGTLLAVMFALPCLYWHPPALMGRPAPGR